MAGNPCCLWAQGASQRRSDRWMSLVFANERRPFHQGVALGGTRLDAGREHRDERAEDRAKEGSRANRQQGQQRDDEDELCDALAAIAVQIAHWGSILSLACLPCSIAAQPS